MSFASPRERSTVRAVRVLFVIAVGCALGALFAGCSGSGGTAATVPVRPGAAPSATPTPSPAASATPKPSPSATASPLPTPSATASPAATPRPSASPTASPTPKPTASPSPSPTPLARLFVANYAANSVDTYSLKSDGTPGARVGTIAGNKTGLKGPQEVAVDSRGYIFVDNAWTQQVLVYPPNPIGTVNEPPVATISLGFQSNCVAVAANDEIYVCSAGEVDVFAAHPSGSSDAAPVARVKNASPPGIPLAELNGVAFDASGEFYVTNNIHSIFAFPPNPRGTAPEDPTGVITGLESPPDRTGLYFPYGIGLDPSGRIYTVDAGRVLVFAPKPVGIVNEAPLATIAGDQTGLTGCVTCGLAVGPTGLIYVATGSAILVFPPNPAGTLNEAPIATMVGADGGIGVAVR